jgi:hypothetical protein
MSVFWVVAPCTLINTDRRFRAAYCSIIVVTLPLVMEAVCTSETSVSFNETPRCYIPEYSQLHTRRRENVKFRCIQSVQLIRVTSLFVKLQKHGNIPRGSTGIRIGIERLSRTCFALTQTLGYKDNWSRFFLPILWNA